MSAKVFTIDMLPADNGDALWLRFGDKGAERNILIDAGYQTSMRNLLQKNVFGSATPDKPFTIDLLIVTHTDGDHIGGAIYLLTYAADYHIKINNIWFNGYHQVFQIPESTDDRLGYRDGENLTALIKYMSIRLNKDLSPPYENLSASGRIVVDGPSLPSVEYEGLKLTVLGPYGHRLDNLRDAWDESMSGRSGEIYDKRLAALRRAGDVLGESSKPGDDDAVANGSSISMLAEYGGVSVLLAADAFPDDLMTALRTLPAANLPVIDSLKLPHHGSLGNITRELIECVGASHYLVSTNGNMHDHPDLETIKMILHARGAQPCEFHFNYAKPRENIGKSFSDGAIRLGELPHDKGNHIDLMALLG